MVAVKSYTYVFLCFFLLLGCENTNVVVMTDAAVDAVKAVTLSDEEVKNIASQAARVNDSKQMIAPVGSKYERRLTGLVSNHLEKDNNSFNFKVYLTDNVNAFAMADGTIRINSGLMDLMNDQELLFVIGHEMGHVVKEHSKKQLVLSYTTSAIRKGLASQENEVGQIASSVLGAFTEQLAHAQFSQLEELQADQYGLQFLKSKGYDKEGAVSALRKLADLASQHTFLSSHPDPEDRAGRIERGEKPIDEESFIKTLIGYVMAVVYFLFGVLKGVMNWLLSFI